MKKVLFSFMFLMPVAACAQFMDLGFWKGTTSGDPFIITLATHGGEYGRNWGLASRIEIYSTETPGGTENLRFVIDYPGDSNWYNVDREFKVPESDLYLVYKITARGPIYPGANLHNIIFNDGTTPGVTGFTSLEWTGSAFVTKSQSFTKRNIKLFTYQRN